MGFFSDIFNPGKKNLKRSQRSLRRGRVHLDQAGFQGGYMTGAGGLGAGFSFDEAGNLTGSQSLGQFAPFLQELFAASQSAFGRAEEGGLVDQIAAGFAPQLDQLSSLFATNAAIANQDPLARGQQVTDLLRARREGGAQNMVNTTFDRLFRSGGLWNQVTREQTTTDLRRQLADEDLGFQLAGIQQGEQSVQNAFARMLGAQSSQRDTIGFTENLRSMMLNQGNALLGSAQGLSQLPMQLLGMLGGLQGQRSQTELGIAQGYLGRAGQQAQNASLAESTFLNFVQFMNNQQQQMNQNVNTFSNLMSSMGGSGGGGGASSMMSMFSAMSDRRLKTNVRPVGRVDGVNIYAYDYLDGSPGIGVMADEVPHASFDVGGYKAVDYSRVWR